MFGVLNGQHTLKNARNMEFVSQAKLLVFIGIFKFSTHEQQELTKIQIFTSFASQNLAVLYGRETVVVVKRL